MRQEASGSFSFYQNVFGRILESRSFIIRYFGSTPGLVRLLDGERSSSMCVCTPPHKSKMYSELIEEAI